MEFPGSRWAALGGSELTARETFLTELSASSREQTQSSMSSAGYLGAGSQPEELRPWQRS